MIKFMNSLTCWVLGWVRWPISHVCCVYVREWMNEKSTTMINAPLTQSVDRLCCVCKRVEYSFQLCIDYRPNPHPASSFF